MTLVKRQNGNYPSFGSFFDDFLTRDFFDWSGQSVTGTSIPKVNIVETPDAFKVEMAAPGMKKDDFRIELDNNMLTISSEVKHEEEIPDNHQYTRREFSYQSFRRTFHLPDTVENERIKARYEHGLLSLEIPKKEEAKRKPSRIIKIS
ncbi:MAG: Hsp20/alpha crystallin family protein [Cyclobacteriaceae bacterium]